LSNNGNDNNPSYTPLGRADLLVIPGFAVLVLIFFPGTLSGDLSFFFRDICYEIVPKRTFLMDSGGLVLWNPYSFFGMPFAANSQSSVFYPLNVLFLLGPVYRSLNYYILAHYLLAGVGTFFMARQWGLGRSGSVASAVMYTFGGYLVSCGNLVVVLNSSVWLPWVVFLLLRAMRDGMLVNSLFMGVLWGLMVLGGEPQVAYLSGMILVMVGVIKVYFDDGAAAAAAPVRAPAPLTLLKIVAIGLVVALGVSAVQWMLSMEMAGLSNRAEGLTLAEATKWSLSWVDLGTLVLPNYIQDVSSEGWGFGFKTGNLPYILSFYMGVSGLILVILSLLTKDYKQVILLISCSVFFLLLALGESGGLYTLAFYLLPGFKLFRIPEHCLLGFSFFISLLCGIGISNTYRVKVKSSRAVIVLLIVFILTYLFFRLNVLSVMTPEGYYFFKSLDRAVATSFLLSMLLVSGKNELWLKYKLWALVIIIFIDLLLVHRYVSPMTESSIYTQPPELVNHLKKDQGNIRTLIFDPPEKADRFLGRDEDVIEHHRQQRQWLRPFVPLSYGIGDIRSRSSFYLKDSEELEGILASVDSNGLLYYLRTFGVQWAYVPGHEPKEVPDPMPRAYVVPRARFMDTHEEVMSAMSAISFNPKREVLIEGSGPEGDLSGEVAFQEASIIINENERVKVSFPSSGAHWLVLLDTWYPGWSAVAGDEELKIHRGNGFFRAVYVPKGAGEVEFLYRPRLYVYGGLISIVSLSLVCVVVVVSVVNRKRIGE